jgi:hypothetical protein
MDPSEDGDSIREYCVLVQHLLDREAGEKVPDVTAVVRNEVAAEEAEVIRGLLASEKE